MGGCSGTTGACAVGRHVRWARGAATLNALPEVVARVSPIAVKALAQALTSPYPERQGVDLSFESLPTVQARV